MGRLKGKKVKMLGEYNDEVFYMDLNEAKRAIAQISDKYEYYQDKYERMYPKRKAA